MAMLFPTKNLKRFPGRYAHLGMRVASDNENTKRSKTKRYVWKTTTHKSKADFSTQNTY